MFLLYIVSSSLLSRSLFGFRHWGVQVLAWTPMHIQCRAATGRKNKILEGVGKAGQFYLKSKTVERSGKIEIITPLI